MTVFQFVDEHPSMSQQAIVMHFKTQAEGALIFTQATLSQKLKPQMRAELEARVLLRRQQGATNKRYITLLCSLADANSAAALAQWYKW